MLVELSRTQLIFTASWKTFALAGRQRHRRRVEGDRQPRAPASSTGIDSRRRSYERARSVLAESTTLRGHQRLPLGRGTVSHRAARALLRGQNNEADRARRPPWRTGRNRARARDREALGSPWRRKGGTPRTNQRGRPSSALGHAGRGGTT